MPRRVLRLPLGPVEDCCRYEQRATRDKHALDVEPIGYSPESTKPLVSIALLVMLKRVESTRLLTCEGLQKITGHTHVHASMTRGPADVVSPHIKTSIQRTCTKRHNQAATASVKTFSWSVDNMHQDYTTEQYSCKHRALQATSQTRFCHLGN